MKVIELLTLLHNARKFIGPRAVGKTTKIIERAKSYDAMVYSNWQRTKDIIRKEWLTVARPGELITQNLAIDEIGYMSATDLILLLRRFKWRFLAFSWTIPQLNFKVNMEYREWIPYETNCLSNQQFDQEVLCDFAYRNPRLN